MSSLWDRLWHDERGVIGTGALIGIALASTGAQAATSIYGTKKAAGVNERSIAAQEAEGERALAFEREEALRREQARKEAMAVDQARWEDYLRANEPTWRAGGQVLTNLYDLAGMGGDAPAGPNIDALMTSGPQAAGVPEAGAPEGPLAVPRGGGRGAALFP